MATVGRELRVLDAMNNIQLWLTWTISCRELKTLNAMNNFGL